MKNNKGAIIKASYIISFVCSFIGMFLKFTNNAGAEVLLIFSLLIVLLFIVLCISEINRSNRIDKNEKWMWTIGMIFMSGIASLVYLLYSRKRIVS